MFHHADVTDYQSVVNLFDKAFETFKRIDHVVAAVVATASIFDHGDSFDHALTLRTVREVSTLLYLAYTRWQIEVHAHTSQAPLCKVVDVNLLGSLFVTRIASVYLRHNRGVDNDRSILLLAPGSTQSDQARQGVEGIMRSLRSYFASPYRHNLRINTISPVNKPNTFQDVALVSAGVLTDPSLHGKSLFIEGGRASEIEPAVSDVKVPAESQSTAIGNGMGQKVAAAASGIP